MAKANTWLWIGAGVVVLLLVSNSSTAATSATLAVSFPNSDDFSSNFPGIAANFVLGSSQDNILSALYDEMLSRGYSSQQINFMLSQILHETGLLTSVANYHLMNQYNFAGLTVTGGGYAAYNSVSDFMDAYNGFLTKGSNPLGATSLADFVSRCQSNGYFTDSYANYYNDCLQYYNALNQ